MVKVLAKNPQMGFEEARQEAHRLLDKAAGRYTYVVPRVYSEQEQAAQTERFAALSRSKKAA